MTKKPKRFDPKSQWVRYRDGMWIPSRKRTYLYWFKFLQHAERSPDHQVDWTQYDGWGGANVVLGTKFDEWWEERWKELFATKVKGDEPKFPLATQKPKPIRLKGRGVYQDFDGLDENTYYDEDKLLKLVDKDKFLKYMVKSKYRNKPKSKDLKDMFDTYISGDKDMEKKYRKIR